MKVIEKLLNSLCSLNSSEKKKKQNYAKNIYLFVFTAESVCN